MRLQLKKKKCKKKLIFFSDLTTYAESIRINRNAFSRLVITRPCIFSTVILSSTVSAQNLAGFYNIIGLHH